MTKTGTTKKAYEAAELKIVHLFITTPLNRREIAEIMGMSGSEVGYIVAKHHAVKNGELGSTPVRPEGLTPCMLTLSVWPRCHGQGCHWVSDAGDSECQAYNAMQARVAGTLPPGSPATMIVRTFVSDKSIFSSSATSANRIA